MALQYGAGADHDSDSVRSEQARELTLHCIVNIR